MATTQVRKPTSGTVGPGTAVGGTPAAVMSDTSDATYLQTQSQDITFLLSQQSAGPGADHALWRTRTRLRRARTSGSGTMTADEAVLSIRTSGGFPLVVGDFQAILHTTSATPVTSTSGFEVVPKLHFGDESVTVSWGVDDGFATAGTFRFYLIEADLDWRLRPTFTAVVEDTAGTNVGGGTLETDDRIAVLKFGTVAYDGVPADSWRVALYTQAQTLSGGFEPFVTPAVWSNSGTGAPPSTVETDPLDWDDFVVYFQAFSQMGEPCPSDIQSISFTVDPPHPAPTVTIDTIGTLSAGGPVMTVNWTYAQISGDPQIAYRVTLWNDALTVQHYDSGWIDGDDDTYQIDLDEEGAPHHTSDITAQVEVRAPGLPANHTGSDTEPFVVQWGEPHCTITEPTDGTVVTEATGLEVKWAFTDDDGGNSQAQWRVRLLTSGSLQVEHDTGWVTGSETSYEIPVVLRDGSQYRVEVQLKNNHGIRSN